MLKKALSDALAGSISSSPAPPPSSPQPVPDPLKISISQLVNDALTPVTKALTEKLTALEGSLTTLTKDSGALHTSIDAIKANLEPRFTVARQEEAGRALVEQAYHDAFAR